MSRILVGAALLISASTSSAATLEFNGANQYVVATAPNLNVATNLTLEAWVKPHSATANTILTRGGGSSGNTDFICQLNSARKLAFWGVGIWDYSNGTVPLNEWSHVAVTYDGLEKKFYINGVLDHTVSRPGQLLKSSDISIWIGRQGSGSGNFFDGELDEVRVWDEPQTAGEVAILRGFRIPAGYTGLAAYYPMDEGTGFVTADASGNDRTGKLVNAAAWNVGEDAVGPAALTETATLIAGTTAQLNALVNTNGNPLSSQFEWGAASTTLGFNGANQHVSIDAPDLVLRTNVTLEAWVIRRSSTHNTILSRGHGGNNGLTDFIFQLHTTGQLAFMGVNAWDYSAAAVPLNEWTHVAVTFDGTVKKFYINGLLDSEVNRSGQLYQSANLPIYIGRQGSSCNCNYFAGELDEVRIWNVVRTGEEIQSSVSAALNGDESGLRAYYRMEDAIGPTVTDSSIHENDGQRQNYPAWLSGSRPVLDQMTPLQSVAGDNSALNLDGVDDHVALNPGVNLANQSFTLECWAKRGVNKAGFQFLFTQGSAAAPNQLLHVGFNGSRATFRFYGNDFDAPASFEDSDWHHWAFTYNTTDRTRTIYRDGVVVGQNTASANFQGSGPLYLGKYNVNNYYFDGQMDDVRIWNVVRTPDQIRQFSAEPVSPDDSNLLLNYRFDETSGTVAVDSRSNSPQDGTLVNGADRRSFVPVSTTLGSLAPGTVYHHRSVANNVYGRSSGQVERFVTPAGGAGTALEFDGANDHVRIAGFGNEVPTDEVTVEFWQRVHSVKSQATFNMNGNRFNAHVPWNNGWVYWEFGGVRLNYLPPAPIVGTWQHFALISSKAGDYMRIYRNGLLEAERTGAGSFTPGDFDLFLGSGNNGGQPFDGEIDEFRIWNVVRTANEIQATLTGSLTGNESNLVAYYRVDGGAGDILHDANVASNDGLIVNNPLWVPSTAPAQANGWLSTNEGTVFILGYNPVVKRTATPALTNLTVALLSADITPAVGTSGVEFSFANAALDLKLQYGDNFRSVVTDGQNAPALKVETRGANGGEGNYVPGGEAGSVSVTSNGGLTTWGDESAGIYALSQGGRGGRGEDYTFENGDHGGRGGNSGDVTVTSQSDIFTAGSKSPGIHAISLAGTGGKGGDSTFASGAYAGQGGVAGDVAVLGSGTITTSGDDGIGILALSQGGRGGNGGEGDSFGGGGSGGGGLTAGAATVGGDWAIRTSGDNAIGISVRSLGGGGGQAGNGTWASVVDGGSGGFSGHGSSVTVDLGSLGDIETLGAEAHGIFAQSIGGFAGSGSASSFFASGGDGGSAGDGGNVEVTNEGTIVTKGEGAHAVFAESIGGGGGSGGGGGLFDAAGLGGVGGDGGIVSVNNLGLLSTHSDFSRGVFAQSVGGSGGNGGNATGLFYSVGGAGGKGGHGDTVTVTNQGEITTSGSSAVGIFAQSVGGGGGTGGGSTTVGVWGSKSVGGRGGDGGDGALVNVHDTTNQIATLGDNAHGIFAQSVGGGGGSGGFAIAGAVGESIAASIAIGGSGGDGGSGSNVVVFTESTITTKGTNAHGVFAQSVGGGGGSGGLSVAATGSGAAAVSISMGGSGGMGGRAESVSVTKAGGAGNAIHTEGEHSYGILAQSVGGGGGDGGLSVAGSVSGGAAVPLSFGGSGGAGGIGGDVDVNNASMILTEGKDSHGIFAQSVGGGGGSGGFSVSGGVSGGASVGAAFGGKGGGGAQAGNVLIDHSGTINTTGGHSYGILAQSIGGGGGDGGFSVAGGVSGAASVSLSMGGDGGVGGVGGTVDLNLSGGDISTAGDNSHALFAQSVGGGGGSGGVAISGGISGGTAVSLGIGGPGGAGADAKSVAVNTSNGVITTDGDRSYGLLAQSVGGGGGDGGFSVAGGISSAPAVSVSLGGAAGVGGNGAAVLINNDSVVTTSGSNSHAIFAQSVGGGGGSGGFSVAGGVSFSGSSISASIGGKGGSGGMGGNVVLTNSAALSTSGERAYGILAQSVGGGGGNGGMSFSGSVGGTGSKNVSFALGGNGGTGNAAGSVEVENTALVETSGTEAHGIFAQSIGGSGGNGGTAVALALSASGDTNVYNLNVAASVGGGGGTGGIGKTARVHNDSNVFTRGESSHGIFVQSVGGGGGSGGASVAVTGGWNPEESNAANISLAVGGAGGDGNSGGDVEIVSNGDIETLGQASYGINAQSVGGGGGVGGTASAMTVSLNPDEFVPNLDFFDGFEKTLDLAIGGSGGGASGGGLVTVTNMGGIVTRGNDAYGIFAQSVGGGGGVGGAAEHDPPLDFLGPVEDTAQILLEFYEAFDKFDTLQIVLGGRGGSAGEGGDTIVNNTGSIETFGDGSDGIFAESIGGGGGLGGRGATGFTGTVGVGGAAGTTGDGGQVLVEQNGDITTHGINSHAITAQSIGGGGGMGGSVDRGLGDLDVGLNFGYGNGGGNGGNGGEVTVSSAGQITTSNTASYGVFAQSVGGGGGVAGGIGNGLGFAGSTGGFGSGGAVNVVHDGDIATLGDASHGIFAQSAGGMSGSTTNGNVYVGAGGDIDITVTGDVTVEGTNAHGIFAQSTGGDGAGDITINISGDGTVHGGSGESAGVRIDGGNNNTVVNHGLITTLNGESGVAIQGGSGNDHVDNFGTLIGQVILGGGNNSWINHAGSVFTVETTFDLGSGNTFDNSGLLTGSGQIIGDVTSAGEIRAGNSPGYLTIDGSLSLSASAGMFFEIGGIQKGVSHDFVEVTSFVELAGSLRLSLDNNFIPSSSDSFTLMEFDSATGLFGNAANGSRLSTEDNLASFQVNYTATSVEVNSFESPDTDGDGMNDYEESLAGTDWLVDTSVLAVSITRNGPGNTVVTFSRVEGKNYTIEYTDDLSSGVWDEVVAPSFEYPDAETAQWVDDGVATGGLGIVFYRVRLDL